MKKTRYNLIKALGMIYESDRGLFIKKIIYTLLDSLLPLCNLYLLKMLIDSVTNSLADLVHVFWLVLAFCTVFFLTRLISILSGYNSDVMHQRLIDYISNMIQKKSIELDLAYYDDSKFYDTLHRAQQEASMRPIQVFNSTMSLLKSLVSLTVIVGILVSASWWVVVIMIVALLPSFIVRLTKARKLYEFNYGRTYFTRKTAYLNGLVTRREYAKELRAYSLGNVFISSYKQIRRELVVMILRISKRLSVYDGVCSVVETSALFLTLVLLIRGTAAGSFTVGTFVMLFEAFRRGQSYMNSLVSSIANLYDNKLFISNVYEFLTLEPHIVSPEKPIPFPEKVESVSFDNVCFSYPGQTSLVLDHFSLTAKIGEVTRIEGENGFGKTTLLKLLLRLYDPKFGVVRINGIDIRYFDVKVLRHSISSVFQDYFTFCFTVRENIEFGDIDNIGDEERMRKAAEMGEAASIIERLPKGYDTPLGRMFDNGEELSMGQLQRIAIARQLYSKAQILAFDEPTAWMDATTRNIFMKRLDELKKDHVVLLILHQDV